MTKDLGEKYGIATERTRVVMLIKRKIKKLQTEYIAEYIEVVDTLKEVLQEVENGTIN